MGDYTEVANSVERAFTYSLLKHENEAVEAAVRMARQYGLDDRMARILAADLAKAQRMALETHLVRRTIDEDERYTGTW